MTKVVTTLQTFVKATELEQGYTNLYTELRKHAIKKIDMPDDGMVNLSIQVQLDNDIVTKLESA